MFLGDRQQFTHRAADLVVRQRCFVGSLEAQLQARDIAGCERRVQRCGKRRQLFSREIGGADQVEAATLVAAVSPVCGPVCIGGVQNFS
jgi:hypothetical protein